MYTVECMFPDGMIMELNTNISTAVRARELRDAFRKQRVFYRGEHAVEFWYRKNDADIPEYIENIRQWIWLNSN